MIIEDLLNWIDSHISVLIYAGLFSFIMLILAAVSVPFIINILSDDYFIKEKRGSSLNTFSAYIYFVIAAIIRNFIGLLLLISGFLMLFIPGQGLLTIFISLLFIDFPGKWKLQKRVVRNRSINSVLNWIRRKGGKTEFRIP